MSRQSAPFAANDAVVLPDDQGADTPSRYAVAGNPVSHSKSPDIHAAFALQTGQRMVYGRELLPIGGFADGARRFFAEGGLGLNVTVPFKLDAHALAGRLAPRAQAAGAVNTLSLIDGELVGDNTDGIGLVRDITQNLGVPLADRRLLLLGAGGAARGVIQPLLECRPALLHIVNRTPAKAEELVSLFAPHARRLGVRMEASAFDVAAQASGALFDVVINGTAGSLQGEVPPLPPAERWAPGALAYDMMYGAEPTVFMRAAALLGARAEDGLGMLVGQAAESFAIWRGIYPDTAPILTMLRAALRAQAHG